MSGAPMWKVKQQMGDFEKQKDEIAKQLLAQMQDQMTYPLAPNVLVDAVTTGGPSDPKQKPLVRHVLIKDLHKIARAKNIVLPRTGVFKDKAPIGLYAIFDGLSCAGQRPGPLAAEFCARNFHTKVIANLVMLGDKTTEVFIKAALLKSFEDLDVALLANPDSPEANDGCGAAVALVIGECAFTAVLGKCSAALAQLTGSEMIPRFSTDPAVVDVAERARLQQAGASLIEGDGAEFAIKHPNGSVSLVSGSLGDALWKSDGQAIVTCLPEVRGAALQSVDINPFLILASSAVASAKSPKDLVDIASPFPAQPRAACGEITSQASSASSGPKQFTTVGVAFLPKRPEAAVVSRTPDVVPAAKKAKVGGSKDGIQSVRLRHILLKFHDGPQPAKQVDANGKLATRSRAEAEAMLRGMILDFKSCLVAKNGRRYKGADEIVAAQNPKFCEHCRKFSDCETAKKGGAMCGDLGWLLPDQLSLMGGSFRENVEPLKPGQWSDIAASEQGLHLIQRIA